MIRGDKVYLTPLDPANAETSRRWVNDPAINRYLLSGQVPVTIDQEAEFYRRAASNWAAGTGYVFEIHATDDDTYIGICGLDDVSMRHRSAQIGILVGELERQDRGYGSDAIMTLVRFGFDTLGLNRIEIRSQADNDRSMYLYEKLGFTRVGRLRQATYTFGRFVDEALFDMLADEWRARQG